MISDDEREEGIRRESPGPSGPEGGPAVRKGAQRSEKGSSGQEGAQRSGRRPIGQEGGLAVRKGAQLSGSGPSGPERGPAPGDVAFILYFSVVIIIICRL
jgi:hypothetical protein